MKENEEMTGLKAIILVITIIILAFMLADDADAQNYTRQGNNFVAEQTISSRSGQATKTEFTYTAKDGKTYPIYLSSKGHAYILKTSGKTGKEYKSYLEEQISIDICKATGATYIPSTKKSSK